MLLCSVHARSTASFVLCARVLNNRKCAILRRIKHFDANNFKTHFGCAIDPPSIFDATGNEISLFMVQSMVEMSTGVRIIPVNADRMINGSHGLHNQEADKWVQFKFTEISEPLAQVWTGIPFRYIMRLEELNEGRPVRNYALRQLAEQILETNPEFDPNTDYVYVCPED